MKQACLEKSFSKIKTRRSTKLMYWLKVGMTASPRNSIVERYSKNEVGIGLVLRLMEDDPRQYVAFFQHRSITNGRQRRRQLTPVFGSEFHAIQSTAHQNDGAMFIKDVEFVETPEGMALPSFVGLYPSDKFFDIGTHPFEKASPSHRFGKVDLAPVYWEVGVLHHFGRDGAFTKSDQQAHSQQIQCASQVVNGIPHNAAPVFGNFLDYMQSEKSDSGFKFVIDNDAVWIRGGERPVFCNQVIKVFLGPINLYSATQ